MGRTGEFDGVLRNTTGADINAATEDKQDNIITNQQSVVSTNNSTTTTLGNGEVFTGVGEDISQFAAVAIMVITDQDSATDGLSLEWSMDNTNWDHIQTHSVVANTTHTTQAMVEAQYFRLVYTNGTTPQGAFRLQVILMKTPSIGEIQQLQDPVDDVSDAQLVRSVLTGKKPNGEYANVQVTAGGNTKISLEEFDASFNTLPLPIKNANDHKLDLAQGTVTGQSVIHKFGANPSISASSTEDITFSGIINWLTAATVVRVKSGGNAADVDSSGAGARTITVVGLDENWADAEEDIALAGTSASTATTITFIRVFRAYIKTVGTYTGANTGDIVIENGSGGTDLITIEAGAGQTETSEYTVPAGKTAYLTRFATEVDAAKAVDVKMWQRRDADDISAPFTGKRLITAFEQLIGQAGEKLDAYISFPAKTDLWWTGSTASGAAPAVEVDYDLILVDN